MTIEECEATHDAAKARLKKLRTQDPMVYGAKYTNCRLSENLTCVPGQGKRQTLAPNRMHEYLYLSASKTKMQGMVDRFNGMTYSGTWEVYEVSKRVLAKLPCYKTLYHGDAEMRAVKHFELQIIPGDQWRRLKSQHVSLDIQNERPHFVPITEKGRTFAAMDSFFGGTGLCPGEILVDGEWVTCYRFRRIPEAVANEMLVDLDAAVEKFMASCQENPNVKS